MLERRALTGATTWLRVHVHMSIMGCVIRIAPRDLLTRMSSKHRRGMATTGAVRVGAVPMARVVMPIGAVTVALGMTEAVAAASMMARSRR